MLTFDHMVHAQRTSCLSAKLIVLSRRLALPRGAVGSALSPLPRDIRARPLSKAAEQAGCSEHRAGVLRGQNVTEMQTEGRSCMCRCGWMRSRASRAYRAGRGLKDGTDPGVVLHALPLRHFCLGIWSVLHGVGNTQHHRREHTEGHDDPCEAKGNSPKSSSRGS